MDKINSLQSKKFGVALIFALIAQMLCWAVMVIGQMVTTLENTLIAHAIDAPVIAVVVSSIYYKKFNHTLHYRPQLSLFLS